MPLIIADEFLKAMGLSAQEALVEIACRLYDADVLTFHQASRAAAMDRIEFEDALMRRELPVYHYTAEDLAQDLRTIEHLESLRCNSSSATPRR